MKEDFISFLWRFGYYDKQSLETTKKEKICVIYPGDLNTNAGPDFLNAKIKIDDTLWVGNVEIHINASDWKKHKHHKDKAYENVILHVVIHNDLEITRSNGKLISTLILRYDHNFKNNYLLLMKNNQWIACENYINGIGKFQIEFWLQKVGIERLQNKSENIIEILNQKKYNWEESLLISLGGSLGMKVNTEPFIIMLKSIPYSVILKYRNNIFQLESLFFGQAGFFNDLLFGDKYYNQLKEEYKFLQAKHKLSPMPYHLWKLLRLRPSNFPAIRIAQLAMIVYKNTSLFSKVTSQTDLNELQLLLDIKASEYWNSHYNFNKPSKNRPKHLGIKSINLIIINTLIPFIFVYGNDKGLDKLKERAVTFLEEMPAESNSIIRNWESIGFKVNNAFDSQTLIHLKKNYCNKKQCLKCKIGNEIIFTQKAF